jgi:hypothetical protein
MREKAAKAPEMQVTLADGSRRQLGEFWKERPLVLVFLRHFG